MSMRHAAKIIEKPMRYAVKNVKNLGCLAVFVGALLAAPLAQAQFSDRFEFLRAIEKQDVLEVRQRLDNGVYINTHNSDGISALMLATEKGGPPWTNMLLQRDANPDIRNKTDGRTVLMYYAERGDKLGVDVMLASKANPDVQDNLGETALMKAVRARKLRIVQRLLEAEPDLDITDSTGRDVFDIANETRGTRAILKALNEAS
ncbi:MAG: ankyrin repeat domain-containing protein [Sphingomonadales bacterium]